MKRFTFPLEKLLRLRSQETDMAKRALAAAVAAQEMARHAVQLAEERVAARVAAVEASEREGLTGEEFGWLRGHLDHLRRELAERAEEHRSAALITERRRATLLAARQREKALARLREHRFAQYELERLRAEQNELDEFGARTALNGHGEGSDT